MNRDLPPTPVRHPSRLIRSAIAVAASLTLVCATAIPAGADELDDRKRQLQEQLSQQAAVVEDAHAEETNAVQAAADAKAKLADAEAELARAESERAAAEDLDAQRAEELAQAEAELKQAKADVAAARAALESVNKRLNEEILVTTQQNNGLLNLALLFSNVDTSNLNQRAQLAETLLDSSAKQLDELEQRRFILEDAEQRADEAEQAATDAKEAAAQQLQATKDAEQRAEGLRAEVSRLVAERDAAEAAAKAQVAAVEQRQSELQAESASVEQRIQERIAAEEKAAREKAAAEQAAREAAAAAKAARSKSSGSSSSSSSSGSTSSSGSSSGSSSSSSSSSGFMYPVAARITSPYGMRLHPVLGYWKLHDGTDFGASCGTPIRAAGDGVVSERYFNSGYGNRLMIDHGRINGTYVTTGYNHATRYTVSVGERVTKGEVIGYVGTTGYSTGCHLHLMVWEGGKVVNPMARWFG